MVTSTSMSRAQTPVVALSRDATVVLFLVLLGAIAPALIAAASGLIDVPRNDDWSYRAITRHTFETGEVRLDGASQSFAVGQVLATLPLLQLFAGAEAAFFVAGVAFSALAVIVAYGLAREFLQVFDASLVVLAVLVAPGYLAYATSFMTDVPALAMMLGCVWLGVRAAKRGRVDLRWGIAAAIVGALAFSVRQFALAAPVAVAAGVLLAAPRQPRTWALGILVAGLCAGVAMFQGSIDGQVGATPVIPGGLGRVAALIPSTALFLLPVSIRSLQVRPRLAGRVPFVLGVLAAAVILAVALARGGVTVTLGNLLSPWGVPTGGYMVGGRPPILGDLPWLVLQVAAVAASIALVDAGLRSRVTLRGVFVGIGSQAGEAARLWILVVFVLLLSGGLLAYSAFWATFDRYLWPLLVPLGILLLHRGVPAVVSPEARPRAERRGLDRLLPVAATGVLGVLAAAYTLNSYAFDSARWRAGEQLVALGARAEQVDAGYEWVGTHAPPPALVRDRQVRPQDPLTWYGNIWPNFQRCAIVAGAPLEEPGFELTAGGGPSYRQFLVVGPELPLYLYRSRSEGCLAAAIRRPTGRAHG